MIPTHIVLGLFSLVTALTTGCAPSKSADSTTRAAAPISATVDASGHDSLTDRADRGRIQGNPNASVWIIEASDFQCPFCKTFHDEAYQQVLRDYVNTGKVRLAYLNFPLVEMHPHAAQAAEAAMCASAQDKFWPMHDSLFASQPRWAERTDATPVFDSLAVEVGVDAATWRGCMTTHAMQKLIDADRTRSASSGVRSTPSFFVGDQMIVGAYPYATFKAAIDAALAKAAAAPRPR